MASSSGPSRRSIPPAWSPRQRIERDGIILAESSHGGKQDEPDERETNHHGPPPDRDHKPSRLRHRDRPCLPALAREPHRRAFHRQMTAYFREDQPDALHQRVEYLHQITLPRRRTKREQW